MLQLTNSTEVGVWSSSNELLATVNENGLVTGVSEGDVIISYTVTNEYGCSKTANKTIHVLALPEAPTANNVTITYDGTEHFASATVSSGFEVDWYTTETGSTTTTAPIGTNAGTYTAWAEAINTSTGCISSGRTEVTLVIEKRALNITADSDSKTYGETYTFAGTAFSSGTGELVNGDVVSAVTLNSDGADASAIVTAPGPDYAIVPTVAVGTGLDNYAISYHNGTLTVNTRALDITANSDSKTYGETYSFAGTEFSTGTGELVNGDAVSSVTLNSAGTDASATVTTPGPDYDIVPTVAVGTGLDNYAISYHNGTLTVTPADLTVVNTDRSKVYGEVLTNADYSGSISGIQNSDNITVTRASTGDAATATVVSPGPTYPIVGTLVDPDSKLGNYTVSNPDGTLTVTPAALTVVNTDRSKVYGEVLTNADYSGSISGIQNSDNITVTRASTGDAATATVVSPGPSYPIVGTLVDPDSKLGNYTVSNPDGTLTVTPAALTVVNTDRSKVYGEVLTNADYSGSISGIQNSDNITVTRASTGDAATATVVSPGPTYPIVGTLVDPDSKLGNYTVSNPDGTLTVTPAALTVVNTDRSKVYGEVLTNADYSGSISGIQNSDNITVTRASTGDAATATVVSPGPSYPIVGTLVDPDSKLGNYTVSNPDGTLTVTPAALTVVNTDRSKVYGEVLTNADYSGSISGIQNSDDITVTRASTGDAATATVVSPGPTYPIVGTLVDPDSKLGNYTVSNPDGTLTVTPAALTVVNTDRSKVYGEVLTNADYSGSISGIQNSDNITVTRASTGDAATATVVSPGPTYPIVGTLVDLDSKLGNYTVSNPDGTLTVTPAALTVVNTDRSKVYGEVLTNADYSGSISGIQNSDNITVTRASTGDAATATVVSPGPTYPIVGTLVDPDSKLGNYTVSNPDGTLTVTPAALTVVNTDRSKVYGEVLTNADYSGSISGIQNSDNITVTRASTGDAATATVVSPGPTYPIVGTLVDPDSKLGNYTVSNPDGTLTVTPAALTVVNTDRSKVYGEVLTNADYSGSISGIQNSDNITVTRASTGDAATATVVSPGPSYPIVGTLVDPDSKLGNYTVSNPDGTLTVTPAALTVVNTDRSKVYGEVLTNADYSGSISGIQNSDNITVTRASTGDAATATVVSPGPTYPIVGTLVDPDSKLGNYTVSNPDGTLTVTPAALTVVNTDRSKVYGEVLTNADYSGSISGIQNSDNITVTRASTGDAATATVVSPGPSYPIVGTLVDPDSKLGNYTVSNPDGTLTVTPAALTVVNTDRSKVYGEVLTNADYSGSISGIQNSDNITVTRASTGDAATATVVSPGPTYPIVGTLVDPDSKLGNYTVSNPDGTLTVTPAALTVVNTDRSKVYGEVLTNADYSGSISGIQNSDNITVTRASTGDAATATVVSPGPSYPIVGTLVDPDSKLGNYTVSNPDGTLTVTPAALTVVNTDRSKVYGEVLTNADYSGSISGIQNSDNITVTRASTGDAATATVVSPGPTYPIVGTLVDPDSKLGNYTVSNPDGTLTVTPAALTVVNTDRSKVYGEVLTNADYSGSISGIQNSDNITVTRASTGDAATATVVSPGPSYPIVGTLVDPDSKLGNYTVSNPDGTLTVTPAALTVVNTDRSKVYGEVLTNADYSGSISGIQNSDNITVTRASTGDAATATVVSPGPTYPIVGTLVDPDSKLGNYTVSNPDGTLTVTPAALTVVNTDRSKVYGEVLTNADYSGSISGIQNSDNITVTRASTGDAATATVVSPGPTYPIVGTLVDPDSKLGNYTVSNPDGTLTVTPAALTVVNTDRSKVYGEVLTNADYSGSISGIQNSDNITVTRASTGDAATATVVSPGPTYPIVGTLVDLDSKLGNYTVSNPDGTLTVTPAALTVVNTDRSKVYGEVLTNADYSGSISGIQNSDNITVTRASTGDAATATVVSPGPTYPIVGTLVDPDSKLGNYTVSNPDGTLTVTPAALTVVNTDRSKVYGEVLTNADYSGSISGIQNSDNITVTRASTGDAATATVVSPGPTYPIVGTLVDPDSKLGNYTVSNPDGTLTVTPAALTVVNTDRSKVYGEVLTNADYSGSISGIQNSDNITVTRASTGDAATATVVSPGPTYPIVGTLVDPDSKLGNYTVSNPDGTLTVTPAALTVVNTDRSKVYGEVLTNADYSGSISGIQNSDNITVTRASTGDAATATVVSPGPTYPIVGTLVDPDSKLGNYTVSNPNGTLTVTQKTLKVTADNQSKYCGQTYLFEGTEFTTNGLINNDVVTSATNTSDGAAALASASGSPYDININNAVGTGLSNYNITYSPGQLTILSLTSIDASESGNPAPINSTATLSATIVPAIEGILIRFYINNDVNSFGQATTDASGTAEIEFPTGYEASVYKITAIAGSDCCEPSVAYLPVYDPSAGFVTGGGWIWSPAGAYDADQSLEGKANFGFVAKYKKGKTAIPEVDGNTEFQFKAGNLNFKSTLHEAGSLVISGGKATYRGEGTINGEGSYKFTLVAFDGDWNDGTAPDRFRIKIWGDNGIVYDNAIGTDDNSNEATELGGGSIVIHEVKSNGKNKSGFIEPEFEYANLNVYPNPFTDRVQFEFVSPEPVNARIDVYDMTGRMVKTVFEGPVKGGVNYNAVFKPQSEISGFYLYRMTLGEAVYNGKLIYNKK